MSTRPRSRGSLRRRLTILVALLVAVTTATVAATGFLVVRSVLRERMEESLTLHGRGLRQVLQSYVRQQHERAALVASRTKLRALLARRVAGTLARDEFVAASRPILLDAQRSVSDFLDISIADPGGVIVTATDEGRIGESVAQLASFQAGLKRPDLGLPRPVGITFEMPLSAPALQDGKLLGVVLIRMNAVTAKDALEAVESRYASGQTRVAASAGDGLRYLFPPRHDPASLRVDPKEDAVMAGAIEGETGFVREDQATGRDVLAAYMPIGYKDWGLVTQVDVAEAFAPIARLRLIAILTGSVVFVCAAFAARRLANRVTAPVMKLAETAHRIGDGDLTARAVGTDVSDELADLTDTFNEMAYALQQHRDHLEELVRERTSELQGRTAELKKSRDQLEEFCILLETQAETIERDLQRAETIQRALLPEAPPSLSDFRVQTLYRPGHSIGGDLYDVAGLSERHVALVVADASGHGVSAAMISVLFKHCLRLLDENSGEPIPPAAALKRVNDEILPAVKGPGMFVTAAYGLLDTESREVVVASAGHTPLVVTSRDGDRRLIERTGPALGLYQEAEYTEHRVTLELGDRLLFYTDGLTDLGSEEASAERVAELLAGVEDESGDSLEEIFMALAGGAAIADRDDVTMLLVEAHAGQSRFDDGSHRDAREVDVRRGDPEVTLTRADANDTTFLGVEGRATWTFAQAFLDAGSRALGDGRGIVVDLEGCHHLDSTFLGTVHELVERADGAGQEIRIQRLPGRIRELFSELDMDRVLSRVTDDEVALPCDMIPVSAPSEDARAHHERLLRAHEVLSSLSDSNSQAFAGVVDMMRKELGARDDE